MKILSVFFALILSVLQTFGINVDAAKIYDVPTSNIQRDFVQSIPDEYLHEEKPEGNYEVFDTKGEIDIDKNTQILNSMIEELSSNGGGIVYIPEGKHVVSTVVLKSNITLMVNGDLVSADYEQNKAAETKLSWGFISAENAENITICGSGRICGSGATFCEEPECSDLLQPLENFHLKTYIMAFRNRIRFEKDGSGRVNLVDLRYCKNIDIHNIEFYESAAWTCRIAECDGVTIKDLVINNNYHVANTDGIDIADTSNVDITHCFIATGDDGICIKADGQNDIKNINVSDCKVMSLANCFKIGTAVYRDVENVTVKDCEFFMEDTTGGYAGISIQADCGGTVQNITVENITMNGITSAFMLWLGDRDDIQPGELKNVTLRNITANDVQLPSAITGVIHDKVNYSVKDVTLENISMTYRDSDETIRINPLGVGYSSMTGYPEITRISHRYIISHELSLYWELPVYGLYMRNADGVTIKNFSATPRSCNERPRDNFTNESDWVYLKNITVA
ncbi:MAG: glycosyl hydrolase family 28 protein [Faecalibacterium sp.]|nr:glycosyl hydrolase family 28 protein [Ruminococcus sp.]MCM1392878.1 glycosyl hydrolase family 28 protein [Ruminococcus sp.]MCM1485407.1 glycosyl hydrolase family 28 protein [Faecalibacterium sp.]